MCQDAQFYDLLILVKPCNQTFDYLVLVLKAWTTMYSAIVINKLKSHFITVQNFAKMLKNFKFINESGSRPVFLAFGMMKAKLGNEDILDCVKSCL